jgi:hypothetical protein
LKDLSFKLISPKLISYSAAEAKQKRPQGSIAPAALNSTQNDRNGIKTNG